MGKQSILSDFHKALIYSYLTDLDSDITYQILGKKTTICHIVTKEGFEIVGTSACVDPKDFDPKVGRHWALVDALNKLGEHHAFKLHHKE